MPRGRIGSTKPSKGISPLKTLGVAQGASSRLLNQRFSIRKQRKECYDKGGEGEQLHGEMLVVHEEKKIRCPFEGFQPRTLSRPCSDSGKRPVPLEQG